jgi:hypothetical protein
MTSACRGGIGVAPRLLARLLNRGVISMPSSTEARMPAALKIFLWSLVSGSAVGGFTFKAVFWFGERWAGQDPERLMMVMFGAVVGSLAVGVAAAVAGGVVAGKKLKG